MYSPRADGLVVVSVVCCPGWHLELGSLDLRASFSWPPSGHAGFRVVEKSEHDSNREWSIRELLSGGALLAEGRAMRHCVATYAEICRQGHASLWSLRMRRKNASRRIATVEVDPRRRVIRRIRARCNRRPTQRALEVVRQWACRANLDMPG